MALSTSRRLEVLRSIFGFDQFRPLQGEVIEAVLAGRDVFVLMPTGGGKSLCYQLPALLLDGLTVVVSPLIALMKDQVDALRGLGVAASYINSALEPDEARRRLAAVRAGEVKLLYVAPERLLLPGFLGMLSGLKVRLFAIDEAHCISEWGHDFRPEYRELRRLRELFPDSTFAALTATATPRVQQDIVQQLRLRDPAVFRGSFNRTNLFYTVRPKREAYRQLREVIDHHAGAAGIVYCQSRAGCDSLAERLRRDGVLAAAYHAGLEGAERQRRQETFVRDDVDVMVATIAFGMGIDKPDVRFVVHYDLPRSLESYYQESGRAGRDGEPSECVLLYSWGDSKKYQAFLAEKPPAERAIAERQLQAVVAWAEGVDCRRSALLAYFDEPLAEPPARCCDRCEAPPTRVDATVPAQMLLSCARRTGERFGALYLVDVLRGSQDERIRRFGHDRLSTYGIGRDRSREEWLHLARELIRLGFLRQATEAYNALQITPLGQALLRGEERALVVLPPPKPPRAARQRGGGTSASTAEVGEPDAGLFERLRALRKRLADARGLPPYVIFHDSTLRQMATVKPASPEQLRRIQGVGERKLADYGEAFLAEILGLGGDEG